jgi:hypothetical protein
VALASGGERGRRVEERGRRLGEWQSVATCEKGVGRRRSGARRSETQWAEVGAVR